MWAPFVEMELRFRKQVATKDCKRDWSLKQNSLVRPQSKEEVASVRQQVSLSFRSGEPVPTGSEEWPRPVTRYACMRCKKFFRALRCLRKTFGRQNRIA